MHEREGTERTHQAIVIGAGPGGLAAAARLKGLGLDVALLERGEDVATSWRHGYDCLCLNTSSWFSYLPGKRFPRQAGRWVSRDALVDYYRGYAASHHLQVYTGVEAERIESSGEGWRVGISRGSFGATIVVVATGMQHTPAIPDWPGLGEFQGELVHAADYRNAESFRGRRVLVVGAGNSGTDIALDLAQGGAAEVWLSARRPPHILRRELWGLPHDLLGVLGRRLPRRVADANVRLLRRLTFGDLSEVGLPIPRDGAVTRFESDGRVPTIDAGGFVEAVRREQISVVAGVAGFSQDSAVLSDGARVKADAVLAATGYRPNLRSLVGHLGVLDAAGVPVVHGGTAHPSAPNLYFTGFLDPRSGQLRELRLQADEIARTHSSSALSTSRAASGSAVTKRSYV